MNIKTLFNQKGSIIKKMWLNQFAFSLFGLFVASPFAGNIAVLAGIFSLLFYAFVVGYAILDDAQKDKISFDSGRNTSFSSTTGFKYSFFAFIPTYIIAGTNTVLSFTSDLAHSSGAFILNLITKYALCGEILGIDVGLTRYTYDTVKQVRVSDASEFVLFLSEHGILQLIFAVIMTFAFGLIYYLAFKGVISVNTTAKTKR